MKAIVFSVPGTGSRFCNKFVEDILGYKVSTERKLLTDTDKCYMLMHSLNSKNNLFAPVSYTAERRIDRFISSCPNIKLISPLRDPYLSYITRLETDSALEPLESKLMMINYWRVFIRKTAIHRPAFVHVNCPKDDRQKVLQIAAQHLGAQVAKSQLLNFVKEWPKVGTLGDNEMKDEYLAQGTIDGKVPHFLDFAVDWVNSKL